MKIIEITLIGSAWLLESIFFLGSLWSLKGEYLFSSIPLVGMLYYQIKEYREYGFKRLYYSEPFKPFGRNFYRFRFMAPLISLAVNLFVYLKLLFAG